MAYRYFFHLGSLLLVTTLIISCSSTDEDSASKVRMKAAMHEFAATISNLIPYMGRLYKFEDQKNHKTITANLYRLKATNDKIKGELDRSYNDPAMKTVIAQFNDDIDSVTEDFQMENYPRANFRLRHIVSNCNTCHSRSPKDFKLEAIKWDVKTEGLRPEETMETYLALKMYNEGIQELIRAMDLGTITGYQLKLSIKKALAVSVRVLRNHDLSFKIVNHAHKVGVHNTIYQDGRLQFWKSALAKVKKTSKNANFWYQEGLKAEKKGVDYGFIYFLEGSSKVNKALTEYSSDKSYTENLVLAGRLATRLADISEGEQDIVFFESCILHRPRSNMAKTCFELLKKTYRKHGYDKKLGYQKRLSRFEKQTTRQKSSKELNKKDLDEEMIFLRRIYLDDLPL